MPALPSIPFLPSFLGASDDAFVVVDRPLGWGSDAQSAADAVAAGVAEHVASTFAEAEGSCMATPGVVAGAKVVLENVPAPFAGDWYVTTAQHVFDVAEGYDIRFEVSGRHDRSLRGLIAGGTTQRGRSVLGGLVPGIVTDNIDDQGRYRVRVALPWLASNFVTDWARVVLPGLGERQGLVMMPEVGDEVLVGFEFGGRPPRLCPRWPRHGKTASELDLGGDAVSQGIPGGKVVRRGLISRDGHKILIDDDAEPPNRKASGITIGNAADTVSVHLDDLGKELSIVCDASTPPAKIVIKQNGSGGGIVIEQAGTGGSIEIKSAGNITRRGRRAGQPHAQGRWRREDRRRRRHGRAVRLHGEAELRWVDHERPPIPPVTTSSASGWAFPPALDAQGGIALVSGSRELEEAMQIILLTYPGERPMRPAFGSRLRDFVFRQPTARLLPSWRRRSATASCGGSPGSTSTECT